MGAMCSSHIGILDVLETEKQTQRSANFFALGYGAILVLGKAVSCVACFQVVGRYGTYCFTGQTLNR